MLRNALRFAAGAAAGIVLWIYLVPAYNVALAGATELLLRLDRRMRAVELVAAERRIVARGGREAPEIPAVVIAADQLTYNVILFLGLVATNRAPFRDRGAARLAAATAVLALTHVLAAAVSVEATYATRTGEWGSRSYTPLAQDFWTAAEYGYRLAGMFAIAFGCWWMMRESGGVTSRPAGE